MRRLTGRLPRDDDRGVTTVVVAVLLSIFLLGFGAISVDAGSWYSEKAQVQNGADAGAMAVAQSCATGTCNTALANIQAPGNSNGINSTSATVEGVCVTKSGSTSCTGNHDQCPTAAAATSSYVDVQTVTSDSGGTASPVPPMMGRLLLGGAYNGKVVRACARATWGPPNGLDNAVALTISACEWLKDTNNGQTFATVPSSYAGVAPNGTTPPSYLDTITARRADPDYDTTPGDPTTNFYVTNNIKDPHNPAGNATIAGSETVITTHGFGNTCAQGNPGWAAPGQFGWLSKTTCVAQIDGTTYQGTTGNTPAPCGPIFQNSLTTKTPIYLPVYTNATLSGSNTTYTLDGFAAFVVTGWDVTGGSGQWNGPGTNVPTRVDSVVTQADTTFSTGQRNTYSHYCGSSFTGSSSDVCVYGYFTKALIPQTAQPSGNGSGNNLGATAPYLIG